MSIKLADAVRGKLEEALREAFGGGGAVVDVTVNAYSTKRRVSLYVEAVARPAGDVGLPDAGVLRFRLQ
jgi:hypothetical protein